MLAVTSGVALAIGGVSAVPLASFVGSLAAVAVVYALASADRGFSTSVMLLAGVTMNSFFSALILFVQYFADASQTLRTIRWLMGDLDIASYTPLLASLPTSRRTRCGTMMPMKPIGPPSDTAAPVASDALKKARRCA